MADSNFVLARGFDAGAAIVKNRAVKAGTAAESVVPVAAATDKVLGVAAFDTTAAEILKGKGCSVQMMGVVEMEASVALAVGDLVGISTNGRAAAAGAGIRTIGVVVGNPATNPGDVVSVLLGLPGLLGVGA